MLKEFKEELEEQVDGFAPPFLACGCLVLGAVITVGIVFLVLVSDKIHLWI